MPGATLLQLHPLQGYYLDFIYALLSDLAISNSHNSCHNPRFKCLLSIPCQFSSEISPHTKDHQRQRDREDPKDPETGHGYMNPPVIGAAVIIEKLTAEN
ncbi:MAG: hypothetical protein M1834_007755 [Cirrosporium novae-zelandiae]|nr:MAG: hypothetical protein M1834_007755 [Cirrosporium novae-zelandiae]